MKRTTVKVPEALDHRMRNEAERRGITISQLTREALEAYLAPELPRKLRGAGKYRSDRSDITERWDELYREALEEKYARQEF